MTVIKAAAVQISPVLYSREGTVDKVVQKIIELGRQGVQFATFPETVVPYYPYFSFVQRPFEMGAEHLRLIEQAVTVPSAATHAIGEACKQAGMVVSIGVNERDGGTLYNTQLLFDADGTLIQRRRKISPTYHERMIWGQGDGSGLRAVDSAVGAHRSVGVLGALQPAGPLRLDGRWRADSLGDVSRFVCGRPFLRADRRSTSANTPWNPVASSSTPPPGWTPISRPRSCRTPDAPSARSPVAALPRLSRRQGELMGEPLRSGEGVVIADLDFSLIDKRKRKMDSRGHL